jgi:hypothetical protein
MFYEQLATSICANVQISMYFKVYLGDLSCGLTCFLTMVFSGLNFEHGVSSTISHPGRLNVLAVRALTTHHLSRVSNQLYDNIDMRNSSFFIVF